MYIQTKAKEQSEAPSKRRRREIIPLIEQQIGVGTKDADGLSEYRNLENSATDEKARIQTRKEAKRQSRASSQTDSKYKYTWNLTSCLTYVDKFRYFKRIY